MSCPACEGPGPFAFVEAWRDPVLGGRYELRSCPSCGVVFSEPRVAVGPEYYEKAAPLRAREGRPDPSGDWRFRTFLSEPLRPGRLLDVGCGDGGFLRLAAARGWAGTGFDYEARMVELARRSGVDAHATGFEEFCRSRAPGEFDAITLFDVLEHTPEPAALLALVAPLLKPGGRLAITLPNALRPLPFGREEHDYPPHHFTRWTPDAMRRFLERRGFSVERQDAGHLRVAYLSDQLYFHALMPGALRLAKRVLFGRAAEGRSVTQLYAETGRGGALADKGRRQALVDRAKAAARLATWPAALVMTAWYRTTRERPGDCLYTLARA